MLVPIGGDERRRIATAVIKKSAARSGESVLNVTDGDRDHFYFMVGPTLEF